MTAFSRTAFAALAVASISAAACASQTGPEDPLQARLESAFADIEAKGFTGVVAVAKDGDILFAQGAGAADPATGRPFTPDTQVGLGSITKTLTGMAAAQLIAEGRLSPDQTIGDFFPSAPPEKAAITVHQLLTHSAGFPGAIGDDYAQIERDDFLQLAWGAELRFTPGTSYEYSNVGFSIAAAIIERVTGKTYEDYLIDDLLVPAGLTHTGYARVYDDDLVERDSRGRTFAEASWGGDAPYWHLIGNGGLLSTAREMIAWRTGYAAGEIVSPEAVDLAQQPYVREGEGAPSHYGYGLVVEDHPDFGRMYWHNGGNPFFNANWTEYADAGYVVFAAANQRAINADKAVLAMTAALYDVDIRIEPRAPVSAEPVELPDTAQGRLARDFLNVVNSDDEAAWRDFIENRMTEELFAFAPLDQHLGMFRMLHDDLAGAEPVGFSAEGEDVVVQVRQPGSGIALTLELGVDESSEPAKLSGLNITD